MSRPRFWHRMVTGVAIVALTMCSASAAHAAPTLQAYPVPSSIVSATGVIEDGLIPGPNGQEWFVTTGLNDYALAEVDTAGQFTALPAELGPDSYGSNVSDLVNDGGNVFELEYGAGLYEISGSGQSANQVLGAGGNDMTVGPDGNVYITAGHGTVDRFVPGQGDTATALPVPADNPSAIASAGGRLFFVDSDTDGIDSLTTSGQFAAYAVQSGTLPHEMTAGPDGDLWAIGPGVNGGAGTTLQRIDPSTGTVLGSYTTPQSLYLLSLTTGPDGRLWFPEAGLVHAIGAFDPTTGVFSSYPLPAGFDVTLAQSATGETPQIEDSVIAPGPDDTLWVTGQTTAGAPAVAQISGIVPGATPAPPTTPAPTPTGTGGSRRARLAVHLDGRLSANRTLRVRLVCTGHGACRGRLQLTLPRTEHGRSHARLVVIAAARFRLAAGHRHTARLQISRRGARRVESAPRGRLRATLRVLASSGRPRTERVTLSTRHGAAGHRRH